MITQTIDSLLVTIIIVTAITAAIVASAIAVRAIIDATAWLARKTAAKARGDRVGDDRATDAAD